MSPERMKWRYEKWNGPKIVDEVEDNIPKLLGEFALLVEGFAQDQLFPGHGYLTGALFGSLHTALPGYNWTADHFDPSKGLGFPKRGGRLVLAVKRGGRFWIQVGSGQNYAMPVHQGHHSFVGYHYLTIGLALAIPSMPKVIARNKI